MMTDAKVTGTATNSLAHTRAPAGKTVMSRAVRANRTSIARPTSSFNSSTPQTNR
jgi:hypothetical protein